MLQSRREMLAACAAGVPALVLQKTNHETTKGRNHEKAAAGLGIMELSYAIRRGADRAKGVGTGIAPPLGLAQLCKSIGAAGVQLSFGAKDKEQAGELREYCNENLLYLEGMARLPKDKGDLDRFQADLQAAKDAGISIFRTTMLSGRRYETFDTVDAFRKWREDALASLALAEPVAAKLNVQLAIENHKDLRTEEFVPVLKKIDSRHIGVCVDTGNNVALLEDPVAVVEALAPWAMTTHLKDMAVAEYAEGFLLSEVPLGEGFLDLKKIVGVLRKANPAIRFNLEMLTRDPLKVPCLTPKYWATFESLPAKQLASALRSVRLHRVDGSLPTLTGLSQDAQIAAEERNVQKCVKYAATNLV